MDIFKQKRNMIIIIALLVILNIVTLSFMWIGRPQPKDNPGNGQMGNKDQIQKLLKNELGFSEEQTKQYLLVREQQKKDSRHINQELKKIKRQMFDRAFEQDDTSLSDSLLNLSLKHQAQLENAMFNHFVELKNICNNEQKEKLKEIMHKLFAPPHPPNGDRPPPPHPRGNQPPPRN